MYGFQFGIWRKDLAAQTKPLLIQSQLYHLHLLLTVHLDEDLIARTPPILIDSFALSRYMDAVLKNQEYTQQVAVHRGKKKKKKKEKKEKKKKTMLDKYINAENSFDLGQWLSEDSLRLGKYADHFNAEGYQFVSDLLGEDLGTLEQLLKQINMKLPEVKRFHKKLASLRDFEASKPTADSEPEPEPEAEVPPAQVDDRSAATKRPASKPSWTPFTERSTG
jgi:hypothetical protein